MFADGTVMMSELDDGPSRYEAEPRNLSLE